MIQDRTGLIWVGTNDGVIVFHPDELIQDKNNISPASSQRVISNRCYNEAKACILRIAREISGWVLTPVAD